MAEQATERTTIAAPPETCLEVALAFERYPEWAQDIKDARVVERDAEGRGVLVAFRAAAMGHSARYTLRYDHTGAAGRLSGALEQGGIMRRLDGEYLFEPVDGEDGATIGTQVTYHL